MPIKYLIAALLAVASALGLYAIHISDQIQFDYPLPLTMLALLGLVLAIWVALIEEEDEESYENEINKVTRWVYFTIVQRGEGSYLPSITDILKEDGRVHSIVGERSKEVDTSDGAEAKELFMLRVTTTAEDRDGVMAYLDEQIEVRLGDAAHNAVNLHHH